jgi:high-affinity nickel-transport protein
VSTAFPCAIGAMNLLIFVSLYRTFRKVRNGGIYVDEDLDVLLGGRGFLARIFRLVFRLVTKLSTVTSTRSDLQLSASLHWRRRFRG